MSKFQILWNYTRKKNGEIVIAEEDRKCWIWQKRQHIMKDLWTD